MIFQSGNMLKPPSIDNWRYNNTRYGKLPISYTAVVTAFKRVFAWICG